MTKNMHFVDDAIFYINIFFRLAFNAHDFSRFLRDEQKVNISFLSFSYTASIIWRKYVNLTFLIS